MPDKRIVVTGIGPITSIGIGADKLWQNLQKGLTNIKEHCFSLDGDEWGSFLFHKVDNFDIADYGIDKSKLEWIKDWKDGEEIVDLYYMIAAIRLALEDSGIGYDPDGEADFGLVLAHENMALIPFLMKMSESAYRILNGGRVKMSKKDFFTSLYRDCLKSGYDVQTFMPLFQVAKTFNVHKYSLFLCNACASGLYAIENASLMIKNGHCETVLVSASDNPDIYKYLWFHELGIYSKDGVVKPFSKNASGLVFGDGGVALVLEELDHAKKRGARVYAEYLGGGFSLESWQVTTPKVGSDSYHRAILRAFEQSGVSKESIELLCPHGFGSRVIDYYEAKAITDIFGKNPASPRITAFKPYVGHNLGGSALLETAIMLLGMKNETILPVLNTKKTDPIYNISLVNEKMRTRYDMAMKTCAAFAGYNAAAIFKRID